MLNAATHSTNQSASDADWGRTTTNPSNSSSAEPMPMIVNFR